MLRTHNDGVTSAVHLHVVTSGLSVAIIKLISIEHCFPHTTQTQAQCDAVVVGRRRLMGFGIE